MIATLRGQVSEKLGSALVVELSGVGYEVVVPVDDFGGARVGQESKFYIYDHVREDIHQLYGFTSPAAKGLFLKLLGVNGVGPKMAMQIMSAATLNRLQQAIGAGDVELFKGVSGVGKKTAERIMVELRGKVAVGADSLVTPQDPAYQALVGLGFAATQAAEVLASLPADVTGEQERVKAALRSLR